MSIDYQPSETLVRDEDPDRFLSTLFAPQDRRSHLNALYAFNIETAKVRERVSQPLPGEIRLQWWRDTIAGAPDGAGEAGQGNPLAAALIDTIRRFHLPPDSFDRFVEARIFDLYDDPMPDRHAFESYAGETAASLIMLAAMVLDRQAAPQAAEAAGHGGVAQVAAGVLRLLPLHRSRGQIFIPADILEAAGCQPEALLGGDPVAGERAVAAMAAFGREHHRRFIDAFGGLPRSLRPAFLPVLMTGRYLDRIEADGGTVLTRPSAGGGPFVRLWTYWRAMRRS
ncbi:phytoene/squalene synthase family protein [Consotaella aegiceratis]|uniref:phytoene/squalene synthase family protein n=1 Tax=Consotaella aegiceratis TaxID=3097961 RepID=UPI002F3FDDAA